MDSINNATVSYFRKTGKKNRLITTYKNNKEGKDLRIHHKVQMTYIENYLRSNDLVFSYTKGKSAKMMVNKHLKSSYFLYIDIKSFFNNIDLNILKEKANFLTSKNMSQHKLNILIDSCKVNEDFGIAIGLIPSSFFSNVYLNEFDYEVNEFLNKIDKNIVYSRYSDDIVISCKNEFDYEKIVEYIKSSLEALNLDIHESKTRFKSLTKHGDHIKILGLNIVRGINENYITVSRKFKREMKKEKNPLSKKGKKIYIKYSEAK